MRFLTVAFALVLLVSTGAAQASGDPSEGAKKAALCAACHGPDGISVNPLWPNLAGQHQQYLVRQIKAFRDGERQEPTMAAFVTNLTDQDVEDLASHFAELPACP